MIPRPRPHLLDWKSLTKGTLLGFAKVQFSSGLVIAEITVHRSGSRVWASPPARPWIKDDRVVHDERGRAKYQPLISFANHGVQASWSRQVLRALHDAHPEVFETQDLTKHPELV
jgi:hypothetical protein